MNIKMNRRKSAEIRINAWIIPIYIITLHENINIMDGYKQKSHACNIKRYVQVLDLTDDPDMIREYKKWHSQEFHWKEIRDGIRAVGILEMEIYISGTRLVMIVDAPEDFDWQAAMDKLSTLPRQAEWEAFVARLQGCDENARSDEKWKMMERMFYLYD